MAKKAKRKTRKNENCYPWKMTTRSDGTKELKSIRNTYNAFVKECAEKEFGLTGSLENIRLILINTHPEIYSAPEPEVAK